MPDQFVVVMTPTFGGERTRVLGPYPRRAVASGIGFSRFGPVVFGNPHPWRVVRAEK